MSDGTVMTNETLMTPVTKSNASLRLARMRARQEGAVLDDVSLIAKPLQLPGHKIVLHNPLLVPYWANRVAKNGRRVNQLCAAGFRIAKETDVKDAGGVTLTDGKYINDDLLLLVAPRDAYYAALKYNVERARYRVSPREALKTGAQQVASVLNEVPGLPEMKSKIQVFSPGEDDRVTK